MQTNMEGLSVGQVTSITQETLMDCDKNYRGIRVHLTINITKQTRGRLFLFTESLLAIEKRKRCETESL